MSQIKDMWLKILGGKMKRDVYKFENDQQLNYRIFKIDILLIYQNI